MPTNLSRYPASFRNYVVALKDPVPAFRLVPLIFSAGAIGIEDSKIDIILNANKNMALLGSNEPGMNPYFLDDAWTANANKLNLPVAFGFGMPDMTDDVDDSKSYITNHLIEF